MVERAHQFVVVAPRLSGKRGAQAVGDFGDQAMQHRAHQGALAFAQPLAGIEEEVGA